MDVAGKATMAQLIITKKNIYRESKNRSKSTAIDGSCHAAGPEAVVYIDHRQPGCAAV